MRKGDEVGGEDELYMIAWLAGMFMNPVGWKHWIWNLHTARVLQILAQSDFKSPVFLPSGLQGPTFRILIPVGGRAERVSLGRDRLSLARTFRCTSGTAPTTHAIE